VKPETKIRCQTILFLIVFFALNLERPALAQSNKLVLQRFVPAYGGSCQSGYPNVLAGSMFTLHLRNTADRPLKRLSPGWPEGYTLEAALDLPSGQSFAPTPGLIDRLTLTPFYTFDNLYQERKLLLATVFTFTGLISM
jgi:hypothetical protein